MNTRRAGSVSDRSLPQLCAADRQILIHCLAQKRHDGRDQSGKCLQDSKQCLIRRRLVGPLLALPETATIAADVPVAELVVDEALGIEAEGHDVELFEALL